MLTDKKKVSEEELTNRVFRLLRQKVKLRPIKSSIGELERRLRISAPTIIAVTFNIRGPLIGVYGGVCRESVNHEVVRLKIHNYQNLCEKCDSSDFKPISARSSQFFEYNANLKYVTGIYLVKPD